MKIKFKFIFFIFFTFFFNKLNSYEIIRDPIFEDYFDYLSKELNINKSNVYLTRNESANAFVLNNNIYFTTGLLKIIKYEDTLKAIYLHEYAHLIKNHFISKKFKIQESRKKNNIFNLFSIGLAVFASNANVGLGTSISLNSNLIDEISKHSIKFEIEADNFMINEIKKNKINTSELISFLEKAGNQDNNYIKTHPRTNDRINNLKELDYNKQINSQKFEWIKSKYSNDSNIMSFNIFFEDLNKGIFYKDEVLNDMYKPLAQYEAFKRGLIVDDWHNNFQTLLEINDNSFLKIEYINYLLENNLYNKYYIIDDLKFNKDIINEYFYHYIYGKYYQKIGNFNLSNFYFCQFYKGINSNNKADFFCKKYDIKDVPTLDKSYALFK